MAGLDFARSPISGRSASSSVDGSTWSSCNEFSTPERSLLKPMGSRLLGPSLDGGGLAAGFFMLSRMRVATADQPYQLLRVHLVAVIVAGILLRHRAMGAAVGDHVGRLRRVDRHHGTF